MHDVDTYAAGRNKKRKQDIARTGTASASIEVVQRYGNANTEYLKGYRGIDHETGQVFNKSLRGIAESKVHPDYVKQNLKQQAGYSAEVAATGRDNAEAIIKKSRVRTSRSEDIKGYGKNNPVVDRVQILDGQIIAGSESQMKFYGNRMHNLHSVMPVDIKSCFYEIRGGYYRFVHNKYYFTQESIVHNK